MAEVTLAEIRAARERIRDVVYHSPCPYSLHLSRLCGAEVYCKLDHLQMTGSFKERGARNKLKRLVEGSGKEHGRVEVPGVVAASAGNHALGLAYHGKDLGIPVTVVMPKWAPLVKVSNCRSLGANVVLHGEAYGDALEHAKRLAREQSLTFVPGFDDPDIIAGQGTMGLEILEDVPGVDVIIVPIGGGGLIAGVALAVKSIRPEVRIIGVEPKNAPTMHESLKAGQVVRIRPVPTLADGLAVPEAGQLCFELVRKHVDDVMLVDEGQIAKSVLRLLELEKTVVEGAGAVPLAAAMNPQFNLEGKKVVLCLCGGNIDVTLISRIIERGMAADGRLTRIAFYVPDRPGGLVKALNAIAAAGGSIKEVEHDRNFGPADVALVSVVCTVETRDIAHILEVHEGLRGAGIEIKP